MNGAYTFDNPAIRIQQSTPVPNLSADYHQLMDSLSNGQDWSLYQNNSHMAPSASTYKKTHQRSPSSSTTGSHASYNNPSFYMPNPERTPATPSDVKLESSYSADESSGPLSNHLPTPSHTPNSDSYMTNYSTTQNHNNSTAMAAHFSMKQALMDQQSGLEENVPGFGHSSRQSVSSYGADSPATPHTAQEEYEQNFKVPSNGEKCSQDVETWMTDYLHIDDEPDMIRHTVPKFERTMTDIYNDELFLPNTASQQPSKASSSAQQSNGANLLSPYRSVINDRLKEAHNARSQSPSNMSRGVSPFRQGSPLAPSGNAFPSPRVRLNTAADIRAQQKAEADAYALQQSQQPPDTSEPKTISPKDALLDYNESEEDSKPLFSDNATSEYENQYASGDQSHYDDSSDGSFGSTATSQAASWTPQQQPSNFATPVSVPQSNFTFASPAVPGAIQGIPQGLSTYNTPQYRSVTSNPSTGPEKTPEFQHPQLISMESSASEAPGSSQNSETNGNGSSNTNTNGTGNSNNEVAAPLQKPANSHADSGTYTCTYHGCTLRFETPQKLQKHKREGHRPTSTAPTPGMGSGMTSAALLARNSQAGPHKCERINPTTGKPCSTVFSRPYDLTRHEDTIHNARKQKVRCALCVEDKTFSRNDALTRHMRVVHPEVDFPGKHRRRGGGFD
ncbi:hypothetical protein K490DRAFT_74763 [Saccharata proteae CBS 121410]|uniref:C2H2-type domain-containing protein n=1 Tax=Saccharata proteae CBS 121410 TaxID=1314787 RepID=A0A9P4LX96_9PEZI|nr:hypothetical protein K490DRAFT_74763 [Saccharata proteae CBS 121410]